MSLVKITTPLSQAKFGKDGFYTCGNYIAVISFAASKNDYTVILVYDQNDNVYVEEVVIKPKGSLQDQIKQFQKVAVQTNTRYERQKNN